MNAINRFITTNDERLEYLDEHKIDSSWWSRFYEYAFITNQINKNDYVLDAGAGVGYFFKTYLSRRCKQLDAIDVDLNILEEENTDNLTHYSFALENLDAFMYTYDTKNYYDKIICCSVLEHIDSSLHLKILDNFKNLLRDNGEIIITLDYPTVDLMQFESNIQQVGLKFENDYDSTIPENAIYHEAWKLRVFRMILIKK